MSKVKQTVPPRAASAPARPAQREVVLNVNKNLLFALSLALGAIVMLGGGFLVGSFLFRPSTPDTAAVSGNAGSLPTQGQMAQGAEAGLPPGVKLVPKNTDPNALHPNLEGFIPVLASTEPIADGAPRIQVRGVDDRGTLDMGTLQPGEKRQYSFELANIGKGDLVINQMYTSCGCTLAQFAGRQVTDAPFNPPVVIKSGEALPLIIDYDTTVNADQGRVDKFVQIFSNDPTAKDIKEAFRETRFRLTGIVGQEEAQQ